MTQCIVLDWQQQDILQLVVWSLNQKELYYLAVLLMVSKNFIIGMETPFV